MKECRVVLLVMFLFLLAACSGTPMPDIDATVQSAIEGAMPDIDATVQSAVEATLTAQVSSDLGSRYRLVVLQTEFPSSGGSLYTPKYGTKLESVLVQLTNVNGDPISVNVMDFAIADNTGNLYNPDLLARANEQIASVEIGPGESVTGWIGFPIPIESQPTYIKFSSEGVVLKMDVQK